MYDLIVIGGGISGMTAAYYAKKSLNSVLVLEKNDILGKKILSTGNGRCNFTNSNVADTNNYHSYGAYKALLDNTFEEFCLEDCLSFVKNELLVDYICKDGYYYPATNQAVSIRNAFENLLIKSQVEVKCNSCVESIEKICASNMIYCEKEEDSYFEVSTSDSHFVSKYLIIATGGFAAPSLGSSLLGLNYFKENNIMHYEFVPALCGILCKDKYLHKLNGVRCNACVSLKDDSQTGQLQFGKDYISGIPVMNLSYNAQKEDKLIIDFLPDYDADNLRNVLINRIYNGQTIKNILNGLLNDTVIDVILDMSWLNVNIDSSVLNDQATLDKLINNIKHYSLTIEKNRGFENAQVSHGGLDISEINYNFNLKKDNKVYVIGELIDIDGICGGYNIHFALASGFIAGKSIANAYN